MNKLIVAIGFLLIITTSVSCEQEEVKKPNVIFILADDLGYGDVQFLNNDSSVPTPNMDRLATEGVAFTDAHSGSAVCTPTRYGVLTGRYAWRSSLKRGVLNGYSQHLVDPERKTVADLFKQAGYQTACIGKWHLGMDMPLVENYKETIFKIDTKGKIGNSPNEYGFDYFYGISASLDFPPYGFMENDHFTAPMTDSIAKSSFPRYARAGEIDPNFTLEDCLDRVTAKAVEFIEKNSNNPFFLYFPLTAPHKPVLPHDRFRGNTKLGDYGDFLTQVDWTVGQILETLDQQNISENTMVILTSDNGSFMYRVGEHPKHPAGTDGHVADVTKQAFDRDNHQSNYIFRGTKADIYEGGHHVPFFVRWPNEVKPNIKNNPICHTDFFSTAADILNVEVKNEVEGEDSFSFLPLLKSQADYKREPVIHHSANGTFAIRKGDWKLIISNGSGGRQQPSSKPFVGEYQLYDLRNDIQESKNLASENPAVVTELLQDFDRMHGRTETLIDHKK